MEPINDYRFARIDEAIRKLADVSTDLSKAIAVLDHRITHTEKQIDTIATLIERRRDAIDAKIAEIVNDLYVIEDKIKERESQNLKEHTESERKLYDVQITEMQNKIWLIEKGIWVGSGAAAILGVIISAALGLFHITVN